MTLEFGKRYTWEEIAEAYPNMYAIYKGEGVLDPVKGFESYVLLGICTYEDRKRAYGEALKQYGDVNIMCTTEDDCFFNGVIFW